MASHTAFIAVSILKGSDLMKRGRRPNSQARSPKRAEDERPLVKSTYLLDRGMKQNLAIAALVTGQDQSDIVRAAIARSLTDLGIDKPSQPLNLQELLRT